MVYEVTFKKVGIVLPKYYDNNSSTQTCRILVSVSTMMSVNLFGNVRQGFDDWITLKVKNVKSKSDIEQLIGNTL